MTWVSFVGFALFAGVATFVVVRSFQLSAHECEVCMTHRGNTKCRVVSAATLDEARQGGVTNACAFLSSGTTDSMACQRSTPQSVTCR